MQPFSSQELQYKNGFYYGLNQSSKNLIMYNRSAGTNQNGVILGPPGTGKSFAAKMEMYQAFLNTDSQIFVIDPEREYVRIAQEFGEQYFLLNRVEMYISIHWTLILQSLMRETHLHRKLTL